MPARCEVGLERGTADGGGARRILRGGLEFGGMDQGEQVAVAVEERAVHPGLPGDTGDADGRAVLGRRFEGAGHSLPSAVGAVLAALAHRRHT